MKTIKLLFFILALSIGNILAQTMCNNDYACTSAKSISINSTCITTSCSTVGATASTSAIYATCGWDYTNSADDDVWFTVTTTSNTNSLTINVTPTSTFDPAFFVYTLNGSCPSGFSMQYWYYTKIPL